MNLAPLPIADVFPALPPVARQPRDRVHAELLRRMDAAAERRNAAALDPVADLDAWKRERDRGDKLRRALMHHLSTAALSQPVLSQPVLSTSALP